MREDDWVPPIDWERPIEAYLDGDVWPAQLRDRDNGEYLVDIRSAHRIRAEGSKYPAGVSWNFTEDGQWVGRREEERIRIRNVLDLSKPIEAYLGDLTWPAEVFNAYEGEAFSFFRAKITGRHCIQPNVDWKDGDRHWNFSKQTGVWITGMSWMHERIAIRNIKED